MKHLVKSSLATLAFFMYAGVASATLIDLESIAAGTNIAGVTIEDVIFTSGSDQIIVSSGIPGPDFGGDRAASTNPFTSVNPFRADFLIGGVNSVSVVMGDYNADPDNLYVQAYDSANNLLDSVAFALPGSTYGGPTLSVTGSDIAYVLFGSTGTYDNSIYFDNFEYTASAVSEPSTLGLLGLSLLGLGFVRRRKNS